MKVGFIGIGNMGAAIAKSVGKQEVDLLLSNHSPAQAENLASQLERASLASNEEIAATCQVIFLGVKPYQVASLLEGLEEAVFQNPQALWVSMAAGLTMAQISAYLPDPAGLIRIMPNTPVMIGQGMTTFALQSGERADQDREILLQLMALSGELQQLPEAQLDAATGIAGCGPAFVYQFIEALADAGVQNGLGRTEALFLASQTLKGSAQMLLETEQHPAVLKDQVTSPGGSTITGLAALEEKGFRHAAITAVNRAVERTKALATDN